MSGAQPWSLALALLLLLGACAGAPASPAPTTSGGAIGGAAAGRGEAPPAAGASASAPTPARPPTRVTLAIPSTTLPFLPFYVAKQKGFDLANGVELEIPIIVGRIGVQSMLAGSLDFSASAGTVLNARLGGAPVEVLMLSVDRSTYVLYGRPEARSVQDLKGKTVAVDAVGSSLYTELGLTLQKLGLSLNDVTIVGLPADVRLTTLETGAAAAAVITPPQDVTAERMGLGLHKLLSLGDYVVGINGGLGTTTTLLQQRPELVDDVVTAALMGLRYVRANRAGTLPLMQSFLDLDAETAALTYDTIVHAFSDGASTPAVRDEIARHAAEVLQSGEPASLRDLYNLGPYERAAARLQASGWQPD